ncbi:MAG: SpoIIE family protein phosphatase [Acidobacteria bacterium]|nr:SpoIIE family protein phosphatase [Acidobacteriota bacterium]
MPTSYSILLLGLSEHGQSSASKYLTECGHRVVTASSVDEPGEILRNPQLDVIYLRPAASSGPTEDLRRLSALRPATPVVLICSHPSPELIREAWHAGATDVIFEPLTPRMLDSSLKEAARHVPVQTLPSMSPGEARLHYLDETGKEKWTTIRPPKLTIGRSSNCDLAFSYMNISRSQAEIQVEDGNYFVQDLGSKHGTYLNGMRVERARLENGDRIQLGGPQGQTLTFRQGDLLQTLLGPSVSRSEVGFSVSGFREIGMLLATIRALSSIPLLDDLLSLVVDTAIELTGAERGFIMLKEGNGDLKFRCARNSYKRPLDGSSFQTSRRVPDEVFRTGTRIVINDLDVGDGSEDHSSTRRLGLRSIFCVPLRYLTFHDTGSMSGIGRMETIGVLYVDSQRIGSVLSNTQIDALETLASEAAIAIYNARLYRESQEKRKLDEELAIAREIQQALLPGSAKVLPHVCAYSQNLPCREVGGDYFDYFELEGGRFGFALGDVSGKGIAASLLASMIQGIFSAQMLFNLPVPALMSNVNTYLVRRGTGNRFVTFFFGIIDPDGNCTYTNAGHNPPFLVRRDGTIEELREGGPVLGIFPFAQYESGTIALQPGDHLVLFTDGALEARNTAGEEFGEERLRALLTGLTRASSADILASLQKAITAFSANTPQHDDITMMVLGYREEGSRESGTALTASPPPQPGG